jgi:hypothetical protein
MVHRDCLGGPPAPPPGGCGIAAAYRYLPCIAYGSRAGRCAFGGVHPARETIANVLCASLTCLHPIGALLLAFFGPLMAVPFVLLHGAGNGLLTIARGTLPLALFGPAGYGLRTGILSAPARILQGGAPLLFSIILDRGGPLMALPVTGVLVGFSFLALFALTVPASAHPVATKAMLR